MQLTRYTDYALRVLIYLAHKDDELATIAEIAGAYGVSENHLMKIVHDLGKRGYVTTVRGKGGGIRLGHAPEKINLGEVVRDTEETLHVVECLADDYAGGCKLAPSCRLKGVLQEAHDAFFEHLDRYTLKDLIAKRTPFATVEFHPRAPQRVAASKSKSGALR